MYLIGHVHRSTLRGLSAESNPGIRGCGGLKFGVRRAGGVSSEDIVQWFFGVLRQVIREELRAQTHADEWVPQKGSALGNRRHCAAVRRRIQQGEGGAALRGKRYLLTTSALTEELTRGGPPPAVMTKTAPPSTPPDGSTYASVLRLARRG